MVLPVAFPPGQRPANRRAMPSSSGRRSRATRSVCRLPLLRQHSTEQPTAKHHSSLIAPHRTTTALCRDIDIDIVPSAPTTPGMLPRREGRGVTPCTSAGRVTAHLLLSFLALSASPFAAAAAGDARAGAQLVLPIEASPIAPLVPEPPPPAEHSFVSSPWYQLVVTCNRARR